MNLKDDGFNYVGLDFETSGLSDRAAPIQLGLCNQSFASYSTLIGGWLWEDTAWPDSLDETYQWDEEAAQVHGLDRKVLAVAQSAHEVDRSARLWIRENVGKTPSRVIAVGWNVASFDFRFLRAHLPETTKAVSYRSVDLNAVTFAVSEALGHVYGVSFESLKAQVQQAAYDRAYRLGIPENLHDAGYDALVAMLAFEELQVWIAKLESHYQEARGY